MPDIEPITGVPVPNDGDPFEDDYSIQDIVYGLAPRTVQRYTSAAERDSVRPSPSRGELAMIGTSNANAYPCWYDGTAWRGLRVEQPSQDVGFPVAASGATADVAVARITIPARDYARIVTATGSAWIQYTQANTMGLVLYAGATVIGRSHRNVASGVGDSFHALSDPIALAAGASLVLELRASRIAGTGSFGTSISGKLTTLSAIVTPA